MLSWLNNLGVSTWGSEWLMWLIDASIKTTVVLAIAILCIRLLRRSDARVRQALWSAALLGTLAMPIVSRISPAWHLGLWPAPAVKSSERMGASALSLTEDHKTFPQLEYSDQHASGQEANNAKRTVVVHTPAQTTKPTSEIAMVTSTRIPWAELIVGLWLTGAVFLLGRMLLGCLRAHRLTRTATPTSSPTWRRLMEYVMKDAAGSREVRLLEHDRVSIPFTWGVLRPVVLLPRATDSWSFRHRQVVLQHELAHIRRNDWAIQILAHIVSAFYWFNPLVWIATRGLFIEREHACDLDVIARGTRPSEYAAHLIDVATQTPQGKGIPSAALAMTWHPHLEERVMFILDSHCRRRGAALIAPVILGMGVLAGLLSVLQLGTEDPERASDPTITLRGGTKKDIDLVPSRLINFGGCDAASESIRNTAAQEYGDLIPDDLIGLRIAEFRDSEYAERSGGRSNQQSAAVDGLDLEGHRSAEARILRCAEDRAHQRITDRTEPFDLLHGIQDSPAVEAINTALRDEPPIVRRMALLSYALSAPDDEDEDDCEDDDWPLATEQER